MRVESLSNPEPRKLRCGFCGKRFKKGGTRYRLRLELFSDFDGYLEDFSIKPDDFLKKKIENILEQTEGKTEKELEEEIYLKKDLLLCVNCRNQFHNILKDFERNK